MFMPSIMRESFLERFVTYIFFWAVSSYRRGRESSNRLIIAGAGFREGVVIVLLIIVFLLKSM